MEILVTYDVSTESKEGRRRLRHVAIVCQAFGQRVQKSVFECSLGDMQLEELKHKLLEIINEEEDSLRIYHIRGDVEEYGLNAKIDFDDPLIV